MRALAYLAVLTLLTASCATAPTDQSLSLRETGRGLYASTERACTTSPEGISYCDHLNIKLSQSAQTIPARIGTTFGVTYKVTGGTPGSTVMLHRIWRFPPQGIKTPASDKPITQLGDTYPMTVGQSDDQVYTFDDPWELVPGVWTLEIWQGDKKLLLQSFTVTLPHA